MTALCLLGIASAGAQGVTFTAQAEELTFIETALLPVWEGNTAYNETVLPVQNEYGGIDPITLLYPIEEVVSVQNAEMTVTYQKGVDYAVSGGRLIIADDGNIPIVSYTEFHPETGQSGFESKEGGYVCFSEGTWFHERQIVVTYKHTAQYNGYLPSGKDYLLTNIKQKLSNQTSIDMLVFGDSISVGANSSGFTGIAPFLPTYPELFKAGLENQYGVTVNLTNPSVGGMGIDWGLQQIDGVLSQQTNLDLAVVAFGMNDGNLTSHAFAQKANRLVSAIQEKFPTADVLLVATMLPNRDAERFYLNQENFADAMLENCEKQGVAVVNMTAMHTSLLTKKSYADMTGNNVNHPNDYLARVYAQSLLATLRKTTEETPENNEGENVFDTVESNSNGCMATVEILPACAMTALGAAAILKKKKEK